MIVLFPFVGFWLWAYIVISVALLSSWVYKERYWWATFYVLVSVALLSVTGNIPIVDLLQLTLAEPHIPAMWIGGFLLAGVFWATFKWRRLLIKIRGEISGWREIVETKIRKDLRRDWERENERSSQRAADLGVKSPESKPYDQAEEDQKIRDLNDATLNSNLPSKLSQRHVEIVDGNPKLDVSKYKSRIIGWMAYWPISMVMWILGDFLADLFEALYNVVKGFYQGMADRALKG